MWRLGRARLRLGRSQCARGSRRRKRLAMREFLIIPLVCCCAAVSSARAIDCLSVPGPSESGWWSWREIDGRKCWYKKVGAVPPKSEFVWPEPAEKTPLAGASARQELSSRPETEATAATLPQIEVARVKPVDLTAPNFRLSDGRIGLLEGFNLSGARGLGGTWDTPAYFKFPPDTFDARYGRW
jgi:hypothetical protein